MELDFSILPKAEAAPDYRPSFNVGALLDVPTGQIVRGKDGEPILLGGCGQFVGVVGVPNSFKTTLAEYMQLTIGARFRKMFMDKHDTEISAQPSRTMHLASQIHDYRAHYPDGEDLTANSGTGRWMLTDQITYWGDEWFTTKREFLAAKVKAGNKLRLETPYTDPKGQTYKVFYPTSTLIDSLTKFRTSASADMDASNELGASGANTIYMKDGNAKARMVTSIPRLAGEANHIFIMTAHVGKSIGMDPNAPPPRKLSTLKNGDTVKGVSDDFLFLTNQCWQATNVSWLINDTTKAPEYPRDTTDNVKGDTDLALVTFCLLRNKTGPSGMYLRLVVSQEDGVQPALTEFNYIKDNGRWGLGTNVQNYQCDLLPDVKLSRTAVRGKLERDAKLRRAINICSEILQMKLLWDKVPQELFCTPLELYNDLKAKGYDWDILLNTRGWYTYDGDHPQPYLCSYGLLEMRAGLYHPKWYPVKKEDLKPITV